MVFRNELHCLLHCWSWCINSYRLTQLEIRWGKCFTLSACPHTCTYIVVPVCTPTILIKRGSTQKTLFHSWVLQWRPLYSDLGLLLHSISLMAYLEIIQVLKKERETNSDASFSFFTSYSLFQNTWKQKIMISSPLSYSEEHLPSQDSLSSHVMSLLLVSRPPVTCETSVVSRISWPHCVPAASPPSPCEPRPATPNSPDPAPQTAACSELQIIKQV